MYHLTKDFSELPNENEIIFEDILKNNYSKSIIKKYSSYLLYGRGRCVDINLGTELRNALSALSILACSKGLKIVSQVRGEGCFTLNTNFINILISCAVCVAKATYDKTVYIEILIKENKVFVMLHFKNNAPLPETYAEQVNSGNRAIIKCIFKFKACCDGKRTTLREYLFDRLSAVNVALL